MKMNVKATRKIKVGIGFVTGRKNFKNIIKTYVENWSEHGHRQNKEIELHAIVAYDLNYTGTQERDFTGVKDEVEEYIDSINFISNYDCSNIINRLAESGVATLNEGNLVFGEGYGRKRNLVLFWAIQNDIDYLMFLDDDEYPIVPIKIMSNKLTWIGQNVLGTHLKNIRKADITVGHHCGYISPIPYIDFNEEMPEHSFKEFIEAISNDIVNWKSIKQKLLEGKGVTYGDAKILLNPMCTEIKQEQGGKWIPGSNVCINLTNPDTIPPYYNPPGARGEDTFLSTCINDLKVLRVPCYTFHDGFLKYSQLLSGVLPHNLKPVLPYEEVIKKRFVKACLGWIRYKPLLMYITRQSTYKADIKLMREKLERTIPMLNDVFETGEFSGVIQNLQDYDQNVSKHYDEYKLAIEIWHKIVLNKDKISLYSNFSHNKIVV